MGGEGRERRRWARWVAVAAWVAVIVGFGGAHFSADATSRFLRPLLEWLVPNAGAEARHAFHFAVRKAAHMVEYGVLAILAWRAARPDLGRLPSSALALGLVLAVAIADESRQAGLTARSGSPRDVALDLAGACLALALGLALRALRRRATPGPRMSDA